MQQQTTYQANLTLTVEEIEALKIKAFETGGRSARTLLTTIVRDWLKANPVKNEELLKERLKNASGS